MTTDALALVDRDRLTAFVGSVAPVDGPLDVELLSGGHSNLTYSVTAGAHEYVARRRPLGTVPSGAHDMSREYRVLAALGSTELPVPQVFGYCEDDAVLGAPFYLMSRVHGAVLHQRADVAALPASTCRGISEAVVDVLCDIHRVDPPAVGLGDLGRPEGFVARRLVRWMDQWDRNPHRDQPSLHPIGEQLLARVPTNAGSTLVHGDFRLGNLMVDLGTPARVAGVLDWEMSTLGDPLTDMAHLMVYWEPTRGRLTHESQRIAGQPGFLTASGLADRYAESTGRDLGHLDFYLAFEHWRAAIIKEGIYMRHVAGDDHDAGAGEIGASVPLHLDEAADLLG